MIAWLCDSCHYWCDKWHVTEHIHTTTSSEILPHRLLSSFWTALMPQWCSSSVFFLSVLTQSSEIFFSVLLIFTLYSYHLNMFHRFQFISCSSFSFPFSLLISWIFYFVCVSFSVLSVQSELQIQLHSIKHVDLQASPSFPPQSPQQPRRWESIHGTQTAQQKLQSGYRGGGHWGNFWGDYRPRGLSQHVTGSDMCPKCGKEAHMNILYSPATNRLCNLCHRRGHSSAICRTARHGPNERNEWRYRLPINEWVSEQFLNGTSAQCRLYRAI